MEERSRRRRRKKKEKRREVMVGMWSFVMPSPCS
jgi:hypothetical protein